MIDQKSNWNDVKTNPSGEIFHELSEADMLQITGGEDITPASTPASVILVTKASSPWCVSGLFSLVSGVPTLLD